MKKAILATIMIVSLFFAINNEAVSATTVQEVLEPGMNFSYHGNMNFNTTQAMLITTTLSPNTNPVLVGYNASILAVNVTGNANIEIRITDLLPNNEVNTTEHSVFDLDTSTIVVSQVGQWDGSKLVWNNGTLSAPDHDVQDEVDNSSITYTNDYFPDYEQLLEDLMNDENQDEINDEDTPSPIANFFDNYSPDFTMDSSITTETLNINNQTFTLDVEAIEFTLFTNHSENGTFDLYTDEGDVIHDVPYVFNFVNSVDFILKYDVNTNMLVSYYLDMYSELVFIFNLYDSQNDISVVAGFGGAQGRSMDISLYQHSRLYRNEPEPTASEPFETNSTSPALPLPALEYGMTLVTISFLAVIPVIRKKANKA